MPTADEIGRGPHAISDAHAAGIVISHGLQESSRLEQLALAPQMRAEAWEQIVDTADVAWRKAEAEYVERVAYYRYMLAVGR